MISIHALREEGDFFCPSGSTSNSAFLSTPSARRATSRQPLLGAPLPHFYPRPPRGGRPAASRCSGHPSRISIHALREEGDCREVLPPRQGRISIHALREEGDMLTLETPRVASTFLSTPSARRATGAGFPAPAGVENFYPRPPRGGRLADLLDKWDVSIISIHALREEGDLSSTGCCRGELTFLSTPSARRATPHSPFHNLVTRHFYPRPPRGGRRVQPLPRRRLSVFLSTPSARRATGAIRSRAQAGRNFYPRPPRGGRRARVAKLQHKGVFLSTPSARRATLFCHFLPRPTHISIHALREEGDDHKPGLWYTDCAFLSTPSARRATTRSCQQLCRVTISIHALREEGDILSFL